LIKILLNTLLLSSLVFAQQSIEEKKAAIADTKAQIAALQASLKKLENSLPSKVKEAEELKLAQEADKYAVKTHTEFGYVNSKGNTNTQSLAIDATVKKNWDKHSLSFLLDSEYASDNGVDTKNKYLTELNYDYKLSNRMFFEYLLGYKYDEFSGYDYKTYTGPGLKYDAIVSKKHNLSLSNNILYAIDKAEDTQITNKYASYRAKALYSWQILENLKFEETLTYRTELGDFDNSFIFSKTAFISKLSDIFSVSLSYKVDYVNKPESGNKNTDRTMGANLIADF